MKFIRKFKFKIYWNKYKIIFLDKIIEKFIYLVRINILIKVEITPHNVNKIL